jgi:hypothetical protein
MSRYVAALDKGECEEYKEEYETRSNIGEPRPNGCPEDIAYASLSERQQPDERDSNDPKDIGVYRNGHPSNQIQPEQFSAAIDTIPQSKSFDDGK